LKNNPGTPDKSEIFNAVVGLLEPWVDDPDRLGAVTEDTNPIMELGLDSVAVLQLILGIEENFGVRIGQQHLDAQTFSSIGTLVRLVEAKINADN